MIIVPVKTPSLVKKIFRSYVWDIKTKTDEKILYLTFDDGPTPEITDWTLDVLKQYNAKATFFCIGNNIEKYPTIFQRIHNEGHSAGNHTLNHCRGWKTKTKAYVDEVIRTQECIHSKIDNHQSTLAKFFRPPYGQITSKQGKSLLKLGYKIIMWDILAFDWKDSVTNEQCYQNVISKATSGSIIVFHDSVKASERMQYALPKVLDYFSEKGFEFRRIPG
ncbi:MAG: polysaccharide deacetylase family protein [Gelidibacter sp.]